VKKLAKAGVCLVNRRFLSRLFHFLGADIKGNNVIGHVFKCFPYSNAVLVVLWLHYFDCCLYFDDSSFHSSDHWQEVVALSWGRFASLKL